MHFLLFKPHYLFLNTIDYNNYIFLNQPNIFKIPSLLPNVSNSIYDLTPTLKFMALHNTNFRHVSVNEHLIIKQHLIRNAMLEYDFRIENLKENYVTDFIDTYCNTVVLN
jgi:hypothetical protein